MKREGQFVICVGNKGYAASLELRKIYQVIPDKAASRLHQIRVIDESGEDYLYPREFFAPTVAVSGSGKGTALAVPKRGPKTQRL